ncbi:solute carrier family 12 member 2-like isoform X2 [Stegodyphus dumicola]|uniref:solute carrier family 12 member 2-like isoform X2 n=1 Tax=Stegodyphus dumicola TaxID=202533 RepID=UPI0015AD1483|nr:solute carrier family 12 member 2-like isoform X2 [Stegodyphus dumicola]
MESDGSTGNFGSRFRISVVGSDNPAFDAEDNEAQAVSNNKKPSRLSLPDVFASIIPGRRRSSSLIITDNNENSEDSIMDYNQEAAPRLENYRNSLTMHKYMIRPSLDELHEAHQESHPYLSSGKGEDKGAVKFGWIKGVYIRCLLNIWGVMLFLRMGWMTGQCGIILAIVIVFLSTVVTIITTLSMSAICTNGDVRGGGAYYLISRSLGPEFGGVVGILLFLANAVSGAMYIIGAGEAIRDILREFHTGLVEYPSGINDIRLTSVICLLLMMSITGIGMAFENKTQMLLLVILLVAMMDYFVGACFPPTLEQKAEGFWGWNVDVAVSNMGPDFRNENFFSVFAVFFPSVTGILAGANISGDLKDPCSAIPKGTLLSILTTSLSYVLLIIWLGFTTVRDATGDIQDYINETLQNCTLTPCEYGLQNDYQVMKLASAFPPLIYAGIFAATLSSALVSIVSAPRILQALCLDGLIPSLTWLGKGYGADNDPRRSLALTFVIAVVFTLIGDLNAVAPIISNFFMAANGLINFSCFHASYVKSPGFRPGFQYYNLWLSLLGALLCFVIMFVMNWITALVTDVVVIALYIYLSKTCPDINWGSSFQGYVYRNALHHLNKLSRVEEHVKNYRPAVLVLSGNASSRPQLVDLAGHFTKDLGLQICARISKESKSWQDRRLLNEMNSKWLTERKVKAFFCLVEADTFLNGVCSLIQTAGIGKMKPNILMVGFKENWKTCDAKETLEYFDIIHETLDAHLSLCILRVLGGTDYSLHFDTEEGLPVVSGHERKGKARKKQKSQCTKLPLETVLEEPSYIEGNSAPPSYANTITKHTELSTSDFAAAVCKELQIEEHSVQLEEKEIYARTKDHFNHIMANTFHHKQKKGNIDVWWLYDDGGLTLLLPYILTTRSRFKDCKLRVFSVAQDDKVISDEQRNLAALLRKFRIPFTDLSVLSSAGEPLHQQSAQIFENTISKWLTKNEAEKDPVAITRSCLNSHKKKTNQFLRLRELLEKHSKSSNMVIMTLPLPRKDHCPAFLYMAWLDILTNGMPPFLLVRGNQNSVLTFYS